MTYQRRYDGKYRGPRQRTEPYVKNSTKGGSLLHDTMTFKRDALVQVWCHSRELATLSNWLDESTNGVTRFMSEVVQNTLSAVVSMLVENGDVKMVEDSEVARDILFKKYRVDLNPNNKGMKNVHHNRLLSEKRKGLAEFAGKKEVFIPTQNTSILSKDKLAEMVETFHNIPNTDAVEQGAANMKRFNENYVADETGAMVLREPLTAKPTIQQPTIAIESKRDPSVVDNLKTDVLDDLKKGKKDDRPRQLSSSELEDKAIERAKKDREYERLLKEATLNVPEATAKE